jgi:4-hydroxythreonine-4-phosphate dehydrogenase
MKYKPLIAITMGDPAGIGPEIICKVFQSSGIRKMSRPVVIGDLSVMEETIESLGFALLLKPIEKAEESSPREGIIEIFDLKNVPKFKIGKPSSISGKAVYGYIKKAVSLAMAKEIDAIVTAPINKETLKMAGLPYTGHTEILAKLTGTKDFGMMLIGGPLRVILVTTHLAIKDIPSMIKKENVLNTIILAHNAMLDLAIKRPKIAVSGLNPHAGEGGMFGKEELEEIIPAIEEARKKGINVSGPVSPDTLFHKAYKGEYNVIVSMYHDQGLIPLKMLSFGKGVNVTVGLPIIRTSVDHGTAYDIAGKGIADPSSLSDALKLAVKLVELKRKKYS